MISVTHFAAADDAFEHRAQAALRALAARPGYLSGRVGRSTDDAECWVLVSEWENVGSYRRALSNYDVKVHAAPLLAEALDLPSAFEALLEAAPGGEVIRHASDLDLA